MFACPHCGKAIEIGGGPREPMPWYRIDPGNPKVSLGCGTLLLIGIIVAICSGGPSDREFNDLRRDIQRLEQKVEALTKSIDQPVPVPAEAPAAK
jgi:hypothetical protein